MRFEHIRTREAHLDVAWSLDWRPNIKELAVASADQTITIYKQPNWELAHTIKHGHNRTIRRVRYSPCGKWLASCGFDCKLVLYDVASSYDVIEEVDAHQSEVKCVQWSPNGSMLATCSRDKDCWVWVVNESELELLEVLRGHKQDVKYVNWSADSQLLASCSYDNTVRLYCVDQNQIKFIQILNEHQSTVWSCCFYNQQSDVLITASNEIIIYVKQSDKFVANFKLDLKCDIYSLSIMDNLLVCTSDVNVCLFELDNNELKQIDQYKHKQEVNEVRITKYDNDVFCSSCSDDGILMICKVK